jgi:hypothetical protein
LLASDLFPTLCLSPGNAGRVPAPQRVVAQWVRPLLSQLVTDTSALHSRSRISQAAIVDRGIVVRRETGTGTNGLITAYGRNPPTPQEVPTLVKVPTPGLPVALDQPTIGPTTVENCVENGIKGIVVCSRVTVVAQREEVIRLCDERGIFLHALGWDDLPPDLVARLIL